MNGLMNDSEKQMLKEGAVIPFGSTEWRILKVDEEKKEILLISEKTVCEKKYHEEYLDVTWEVCSLRKWLNEEYLREAFSEEERAAILTTHLQNSDNKEFKAAGIYDTDDRIFLLSMDEAEEYFKDDEDRSCDNWYWLRSPDRSSIAAFVDCFGYVDAEGCDVDYAYGVRPAFRLDLGSAIFKTSNS